MLRWLGNPRKGKAQNYLKGEGIVEPSQVPKVPKSLTSMSKRHKPIIGRNMEAFLHKQKWYSPCMMPTQHTRISFSYSTLGHSSARCCTSPQARRKLIQRRLELRTPICLFS
jgi:hypothetical protein